ncbi:MAG: D-alanyl-D-alanine carboxypeptidase [Chlamydiae bacterium]|nr:D-alanyl-D-alanine carboxypeptidase DacF [Chlamydiales bacterium]MCH9704346.1 D-alanyl-D-alanine carboxypeptidase [Chlamydiota bacterium]
MLLILLLLFSTLVAQPLDLKPSGKRVYLMNAESGALLFEKNGDERAHPASTTKIATALYVLKLAGHDLNRTFVTQREAIRSITPTAKVQSKYRSPSHWLETDGTHIGLKRGEEMPLFDLMHAILLASANDACNVVAIALGGTVPTFMENLNLYLRQIGCSNTTFNNPHGLTHPDHLTTAHDLAIMAKEALKEPFFCEVMGKSKYTCPETNLEYQRYFLQTNHLLRNGSYFYPQAFGMKTGTTQAAGKNLVAVAKDSDRTVIGVFMGYSSAGDLYTDAHTAFDAAFSEQKMRRTLLPSGCQEFVKSIPGTRKKLRSYLPEPLSYDYFPSEDEGCRLLVHWKLPTLPIVSGEEVGSLEIVNMKGHSLKRVPLFAFNELKPTVWYRLFAQKRIFLVLLLFPLALLLFLRKR